MTLFSIFQIRKCCCLWAVSMNETSLFFLYISRNVVVAKSRLYLIFNLHFHLVAVFGDIDMLICATTSAFTWSVSYRESRDQWMIRVPGDTRGTGCSVLKVWCGLCIKHDWRILAAETEKGKLDEVWDTRTYVLNLHTSQLLGHECILGCDRVCTLQIHFLPAASFSLPQISWCNLCLPHSFKIGVFHVSTTSLWSHTLTHNLYVKMLGGVFSFLSLVHQSTMHVWQSKLPDRSVRRKYFLVLVRKKRLSQHANHLQNLLAETDRALRTKTQNLPNLRWLQNSRLHYHLDQSTKTFV